MSNNLDTTCLTQHCYLTPSCLFSSSPASAIQEEILCEKRWPGREITEVSASGRVSGTLNSHYIPLPSWPLLFSNQKNCMNLVLWICMGKPCVLCFYRCYCEGHKVCRQCGARHTGEIIFDYNTKNLWPRIPQKEPLFSILLNLSIIQSWLLVSGSTCFLCNLILALFTCDHTASYFLTPQYLSGY